MAPALFVQIAAKGRKLIRENLDVVKPPKLPKGTLREWHWAAVAQLYAVYGQSGLQSDLTDHYSGISWSTLLRLRDYDPPLIQENHKQGYPMQLTGAGLKFYEEQYERYRQIYPSVAASAPSNKQVLSDGEMLPSLTGLSAAIRNKRGKRGCREVSAEIGLSPSMLARIEQGKPATPEQYAQICQWLGISAYPKTLATDLTGVFSLSGLDPVIRYSDRHLVPYQLRGQASQLTALGTSRRQASRVVDKG